MANRVTGLHPYLAFNGMNFTLVSFPALFVKPEVAALGEDEGEAAGHGEQDAKDEAPDSGSFCGDDGGIFHEETSTPPGIPSGKRSLTTKSPMAKPPLP